MKTYSWFVPAIFILAAPAGAQTSEPVSPEPVVVERGPHYRVWQRTTKEMLANGGVVTRRSGYTELAVGMHYLKDGLWTESKEGTLGSGRYIGVGSRHSTIRLQSEVRQVEVSIVEMRPRFQLHLFRNSLAHFGRMRRRLPLDLARRLTWGRRHDLR